MIDLHQVALWVVHFPESESRAELAYLENTHDFLSQLAHGGLSRNEKRCGFVKAVFLVLRNEVELYFVGEKLDEALLVLGLLLLLANSAANDIFSSV